MPENVPRRSHQVTGTGFAGLPPGTSYGGGWQHYEIRLADFPAAFSLGASLNRFVFVNDNDAGHAGEESYFRNIRLTEVAPEGTRYAYDAQDRRIFRAYYPDWITGIGAYSESFVYEGGQLAMRHNANSELTHRYLYGPQIDQVLVDEVFSASGQSEEVLWQLPDQQGTVRDIVDDTGTLRKHVDYDSFGQITGEQFYAKNGTSINEPHAEAVDQLFGFQGREWDADTKLQNNRARWYDPSIGRFLSEDPIAADVTPATFLVLPAARVTAVDTNIESAPC